MLQTTETPLRMCGRPPERSASLAGLLGKAPATCPPEFLDGLAANPDETHKVTIGPTTLNLTLKDIIFDATKGDFAHPNPRESYLQLSGH
ncbi:hypothetical protein [Edaphobacter bradus]|uniref:hypothetical protein n=1 Tax=Edaphobacter bradus TaxID=2259016 RepID=UPI0021DF6BA8|nr:hypothetical protein [Edaphobacter bradus]